VVGSCECGDEPSGSGARDIVSSPYIKIFSSRSTLNVCSYLINNSCSASNDTISVNTELGEM
jgi:hypothetical protein